MKKKNAAAGILAGVLACSLVGGGYSLLGASADVVGSNAAEWGNMSANAVYAEDGFVELSGSGWGCRNWYNEKVKLDGLTIQMNVSGFNDNSFGGFYFANDQNAYFGEGSPITFSHWQNMNGWGTNRFSVAANHDANTNQPLIYTDEACTQAGFGYSADTYVMIMNVVDVTHYTISFESHSDTAYKVRIALSDADVLHANHPNYESADGSYWCDGYIKKETVASVLDANGCTKLCFAIPNEAGIFGVKLSDDNIRAYESEQVAPAREKVEAYRQAEITDETTFGTAMELRETALSAVNGLKAREKAEMTEEIETIDAAYKTNETVQTGVKGLVQAKIDAAKADFDGFWATESTLTEEAYTAAKGKIAAAKAEYNGKKALLGAEQSEELQNGLTSLDYASDKASVLQWIIGYENAVDALDVTSATIGEEIAAVKALKNAFAGSAVETVLNALEEGDKTAYAARIAAADGVLAAKEEGASVAVKTTYLVAFEEALEDLSAYSKIRAAFTAKNTLEENVTLTEEDGELYTRYNTGVETLYTALESYVSDAIASVSAALDNQFETLASFASVRSDYNAISLDLLDEEREQTATVTAAYATLGEKLKANFWYNIGQTGLSEVVQNDKGVYFEMSPQFPNRINYNKPLDLTKGTEVVVEFTNIAYYNGDKTEDGASKGANNLSINFLSQPNSYKSMASGLNIIIWLFETESSVDIVNGKDQPVAHGVIATPLNGGKLTISLKHGIYEDFVSEEQYAAYILTINGVEIVLSETLAEANGITVSDQSYFSLGSFADYKNDPNCFTLVSVDGESFAKKADTPDNPDNPDKPVPPEQPEKKRGCGSEIGAYSALASCVALAAAGVVLAVGMKSRKRGK